MNKKLNHIEINIWKACNNKCIFCMSSKVRFDSSSWYKWLVSFEKIKNDIQYYADKWYKSIWFLWWDISIHPNLYEIISYSKAKWFERINVITNGMVFSDYNKAKKLVESGVTRVNISVHSHISEIEDYLTQVEWWLKKKLKAIDNFNKLYKEGLLEDKLSINIVLNKQNYKTIVETCLYFWKQKNIDDIRINFVRPDLWVKENFSKFLISYTEVLDQIKKIIYISLKYNIRITFDTIPACIINKVYKNIKVINRFIWEQFDHIDEISDLSSDRKFLWKEKKTNELKYKKNWCRECYYYNSCQWIRKEYYHIFGDWEIDIVKNIFYKL